MTEPQGAAAPATPAATPPAAAPAPAASHQEPEGGPPAWLEPRLAKAKETRERELLAELGVATRAEAKAKLEKAAEAERANMTEKERAEARIKELEPKAMLADTLGVKFAQVVNQQFDALPEQARTAIDEHAGGDAVKRWDLLQLLSKTGMNIGAANPAPPAAPTPKPPASTTPAGSHVPAPPTPSGSKTAYDTWKALQATNQLQASLFYTANAMEISRTTPASQ